MKLLKFGIARFRLFTTKTWINIGEPTILIGPNNEGKSTICDALIIFFGRRTLRRNSIIAKRRITQTRIRFDNDRDYPNTITSGRRWPTEFSAVLELNSTDHRLLPKKIKGNNQIEIIKKWSYENDEMEIFIDDLTQDEISNVMKYVYRKINIVFIPAIREERNLENIFHDVFSQSIEARIETSRKIKAIKNDLTKYLTPEVKSSITTINKTFKDFLKKPIKIEFDWNISISNAVELDQIYADDGNRTNISLKGDGIKSLMQMALLTQYAEIEQVRKTSRNNIYIIEEPESHLNSSYLHDLKDKINLLSKNSTTIITTHSPVFVNFTNFESNHLVAGGKVKPAKSKKEIADALGVKLQENLVSNLGVIYVEGYDDTVAINSVLSKMKCEKSIKSKYDILYSEGASKLCHMMLSNHSFFDKVYAIIDNDKAGGDAKKEIEKNYKSAVVIQTPLLEGCNESELEDLLTLDCQADIFSSHYNIGFPIEIFERIKKRYKVKWSNWIKRVFNQVGITFDDVRLVKQILWKDYKKIEFTSDGKQFLENLINTLDK